MDDPGSLVVEVEPEPAVGSVTVPPYLDGQHFNFSYRTPNSEDDYPVFLQITTQGALPAGSPSGSYERHAEVEISNRARVVVSPESACVEPGDSRTLTAQIMGRSSPDFDWHLSGGGSLGGATVGNDATVENNQYLAPGGNTEATVTVTHTDPNGGDTASAVIDIVVGDCDAKVFVDGSLDVSTNTGGDYEDWDAELIQELTPPPAISSPLWLGQSDTHQSPLLTTNATYYLYDGGSSCNTGGGGSCSTANAVQTLPMHADAVANAEYAVDPSGVSTFDFYWEGGQTCEYDTEGEGFCANSSARAAWNATFYVELEQAADYELDVELDCQEIGGVVGGVGYQITLNRYPDGATDASEAMALNGLPPDTLHGYPFIDDMLVVSNNACITGSVRHTATYPLAGPVQPGTTDLIVIMVTVQAGANPLVNQYPEVWRNMLWPLTENGTPPYLPPGDAVEWDAERGTHEGNVTASGRAHFRRVN